MKLKYQTLRQNIFYYFWLNSEKANNKLSKRKCLMQRLKKKLVDKYNISNAVKKFRFNYKTCNISTKRRIKSRVR